MRSLCIPKGIPWKEGVSNCPSTAVGMRELIIAFGSGHDGLDRVVGGSSSYLITLKHRWSWMEPDAVPHGSKSSFQKTDLGRLP